jgi:sugar O-acyltransferase (sialic acid O-acetyltransferase NeuD family)
MAKKVVIFGNGVVSKMLFYDAKGSDDFEIACFTADKEYVNETEFLGLPLIEFEKINELYPPEEYDMMAVLQGGSSLRNREKMYLKVKSKGYLIRNYISAKADFSPDVIMGDNNIVLAQAHVGTGGVMGNNNMIRQNVYLGHNFVVGDSNFIAAGSCIGGGCIIKNNCYIGLGSTIINGISIESETLTGAGSVVIRSTEPYSKNVGNPSRIIGHHKEEGIVIKGIYG